MCSVLELYKILFVRDILESVEFLDLELSSDLSGGFLRVSCFRLQYVELLLLLTPICNIFDSYQLSLSSLCDSRGSNQKTSPYVIALLNECGIFCPLFSSVIEMQE